MGHAEEAGAHGAVAVRRRGRDAHIAREYQPLDEEVEPDRLLVRHREVVVGESVRDRCLADSAVAEEDDLVLEVLGLVVRIFLRLHPLLLLRR